MINLYLLIIYHYFVSKDDSAKQKDYRIENGYVVVK